MLRSAIALTLLIGSVLLITAVKIHDSQTAYNTTHYMAQDRNS